MKQLSIAITLAALLYATQGHSQYLTGSDREQFIRSAAGGCLRAKIADTEFKVVPNSLVAGYCQCYASTIADKIPASQLATIPLTDPIITNASAVCYQAMKAEAIRLYNIGQYPKQ
jgi:hypothetical protein